MSELDWQTLRSTETRTAVWVDADNAHEVAEMFGGTITVAPGFMGREITRIAINNWSAPVGFWLTRGGGLLRHEDEWEVVRDD